MAASTRATLLCWRSLQISGELLKCTLPKFMGEVSSKVKAVAGRTIIEDGYGMDIHILTHHTTTYNVHIQYDL